MPGSSQAEFQALLQQGLALHRQGKLVEAQQAYRRILAADPAHFDALNLLGALALQARDFLAAEELIGRAIAINPSVGAAQINRAIALLELKRPAEALASCESALALDPSRPEAQYHRGNALQALQRLEDALVSYDRAAALRPEYPEAHHNRGNALLALKRLDEALSSYDRAVALKADYAEAWNNRGTVLLLAGRAAAALASYERALALDPENADLHYNRGNALQALQRFDEALANFDRALSLNPAFADAHANRGHTLVELKRLDEAVVSYDKALAFDPDHPFVFGTALHTRMMLCDWTGLAERLDKLRIDVLAGKSASVPLPMLALFDDPSLHRQAAKLYVDAKFPRVSSLGTPALALRRERIRLGYFSVDFRMHAISLLIADLLESHERTKFEVFGFSLSPYEPDEMQHRIATALDTFVDVQKMNDADIARMCRRLGIDIAIDLNGYTKFARPGIFVQRCAPVQVNYLGYPGTMAADFIDYIIADRTVIPDERDGDFTETVIALPYSYQVNDPRRKIADRTFTRAELGLPETGFVFCCFNNGLKILPATFGIWMRLLKVVEGSVLWLLEDNPIAARNLRHEAEARGIDGRRLVFASRLPPDEHLARHRAADLFLDTLPYNAHTTASDALWAGLPLLTCTGTSFASRVAASLLTALGLPELVTDSAAAYEAKALALATNPAMLTAIKRKLAANRLSSPLFDGKQFARDIEAAYTAIYERHHAGLPPACIRIGAL